MKLQKGFIYQDIIIALGISILLIVVFMFSLLKMKEYRCNQDWKDSDMNYTYKNFVGCKVEVKPGVWLPASKVRYDASSN